ncbi:uncharacterized protein LOC112143836 [Oryzias melastigma]|uniref:uncharacterized protein LOC112143836 n=1 Tax=Oryzias melastigma TaxID=30732 RepID=UPI00168D6B39|nr:uncharacterized protein LOC112143836 [Oryzias melastigma]
MQFHRKLASCSKRRVSKVETDYSWALINSALLAFNKEDVVAYLKRAFDMTTCQIKKNRPAFTVVHLCSAHIIKAVRNAISKLCRDKGITNFITHCFAHLMNTTSITHACAVFYNMCVVLLSPERNELTNLSKDFLWDCISQEQVQDLDLSEINSDTFNMERGNTVISKSPFSRLFSVQQEQAKVNILTERPTGKENDLYCPKIIDMLMQNYMGIFPLWSGLLLGGSAQHSAHSTTSEKERTRDTNCHVELWFGIVKNNILLKKRHFRPAEFVNKMYSSLQGRYAEHILKHKFPVTVLTNKPKTSVRQDDPQETWKKRESSVCGKRKPSKYFHPPKQTSSTLVQKVHRDPADEKITQLWKKSDTEVVVSAVHSQSGGTIPIHHSDLRTLRPHQWLVGEVMGGLIHIAARKYGVSKRVFLMDHYTAGVIVKGEETQMSHQSLRKVNLETYEGILGFVLIGGNHWNLLYIHKSTKTVYLMDPLSVASESYSSKSAAVQIRKYLSIRNKMHSKDEWDSIDWKGGVVKHPIQQDGNSCGVVVVMMAQSILASFPLLPEMTFETTKRKMTEQRRQMAREILEASGI